MKSLKLTEVTGSLLDYARDGLREPVVIEKSRTSARTNPPLSLEKVRRKYGLPARAVRRRPTR